jgi:hypothetical protein
MSSGNYHLFIASISIAAGEQISGLTTSGTAAVAVDSGSLEVREVGIPWQVFPGEWLAVDGPIPLTFANTGEVPAAAFVVGIVAPDDAGLIGKEIAVDEAIERRCPEF